MPAIALKPITHQRPAPWTTPDALALPAPIAEELEGLLGQLVSGTSHAEHAQRAQQLRHAIHHQLESGSGAIWLHSAALARASREAFHHAFFEFCTLLGLPVSINKNGDVIKEVKDAGHKDSKLAPARGHMTNQELAFHSDRADITVLACWEAASHGGEFKICSSAKLIEVLEKRNPDWIKWLTTPIPHDLRDEGSSGDSYCHLPILSESDGAFVLRYIRKFNDSAIRHGIALPDEVKTMLSEIDQVINHPDMSVQVSFEKGSIALVNNHTTLHSRTEFVDAPGAERCLLRCWLASEFTRPLPEAFSTIFHTIQPGVLRGGVRPA